MLSSGPNSTTHLSIQRVQLRVLRACEERETPNKKRRVNAFKSVVDFKFKTSQRYFGFLISPPDGGSLGFPKSLIPNYAAFESLLITSTPPNSIRLFFSQLSCSNFDSLILVVSNCSVSCETRFSDLVSFDFYWFMVFWTRIGINELKFPSV